MGIKIHSRLPLFIKNVADDSKTFKTLLTKFLYLIRFIHWIGILTRLQHRS